MFTDTAGKTSRNCKVTHKLHYRFLHSGTCLVSVLPSSHTTIKAKCSSVPVNLREHKFLVSNTKWRSLRGSVLWRLQLSNLASHVAVCRHGGHKILSNFIHVTLQHQTNNGDCYTMARSLQTCPFSSRCVHRSKMAAHLLCQRTTYSVMGSLGSVHRWNNILLERTERGSVHRRQLVSAHRSLGCSLTGNTHSVP
jgi:hypothetical protein